MTNAKVYQGFHDDKKVEEHCLGVNQYARSSSQFHKGW